MNKDGLASKIAKMTKITKKDALKFIDAFLEEVKQELNKKDGKLTLVGFGTFKTILKKKKKGRNPRTGEKIIIPKKRVVKFIPGKQWKLVSVRIDPVGSGQSVHGPGRGPGNGPKG